MGTLADACERSGDECVIATGDRDSLQLVSGRVHVRLASTKMGRPQTDLYDLDAIREKYSVTPTQLIQVKALMGDTSDNIPGVAGIGEKTALSLIARFETVDKVYENLEDPFIKPGVRAKLAADKENAYLSLELARICREAPVETQLSAYLPQPADVPAARALLAKLEMFKMIQRRWIPLRRRCRRVRSPGGRGACCAGRQDFQPHQASQVDFRI
ncbi:MAG: 5'-3' exonuclease H3TH domain-containing protein [Oscillospiraceae bacterium]